MTVLVVGASGATGRLLVSQLLRRGLQVRAVVRSLDRLPAELNAHPALSLVQATLLDLDDAALKRLTEGCSAIASCLGHNLSFKGIYGAPRALVTEATRRLCAAARNCSPTAPVKYVLMNSAGISNRDLDEPLPAGHRFAIGAMRLLLPPHADNENAADYLRSTIGQNDAVIEWAAVRPDTLIDEAEVSAYELFPSPTRSALFDPGKTSRINVAHFMAELIVDQALWNAWKGRMPAIYNTGFS
ncbi:MAG: NAD(P)-dependent oxidoreductase [Lysobacter sp.]|nr:MAG: NAD(P)-dependent oxidoreductase [Lysobacter sp.]